MALGATLWFLFCPVSLISFSFSKHMLSFQERMHAFPAYLTSSPGHQLASKVFISSMELDSAGCQTNSGHPANNHSLAL